MFSVVPIIVHVVLFTVRTENSVLSVVAKGRAREREKARANECKWRNKRRKGEVENQNVQNSHSEYRRSQACTANASVVVSKIQTIRHWRRAERRIWSKPYLYIKLCTRSLMYVRQRIRFVHSVFVHCRAWMLFFEFNSRLCEQFFILQVLHNLQYISRTKKVFWTKRRTVLYFIVSLWL